MANGIDLKIKENQDALVGLMASLEKLKTKIIEISDESKNIGGGLKDIVKPSDLLKVQQQYEKQLKDLQGKLEAHEKTISALRKKAEAEAKKETDNNLKRIESEKKAREAQVKKESDLRERLSTLRKKAEADLKREEQAVAKLNSVYLQTDNALKAIQNEYRDLATKKALNNQLTSQEEIRMQTLSKEMIAYDKVLKKVDADMGVHRRNVGNYASGWNGLSNSINQLTREAPAFAVSLSTGFLALSNNIPILADEIRALGEENKRLIAQGEPTKSVFKQITSSIFSWMTLLSVGVTLLTLYGDEMVDFIAKTFKGAEALKSLNDIQKTLNATQNEAIRNGISEKVAVGEKVLAIQNESLALKYRLDLAKELIEQYPRIFKGISAESLANGKSKEQVDELVNALESEHRIKGLLEQATKVRQESHKKEEEFTNKNGKSRRDAIADLQTQIKQTSKLVDEEQKRRKQIIEPTIGGKDNRTFLQKSLNDLQSAELNLRIEINNEVKELKQINENILPLQQESIKLLKDEKIEREANLDLIDDEISAFELRQLLVQRAIDFNKTESEDLRNNLQLRESHYIAYYENLRTLAENQKAESLRLLQLERLEEEKNIKESKVSNQLKAVATNRLNKDIANKTNIINETYKNSLMGINDEIAKLDANTMKLEANKLDMEILIDQAELDKLKEMNDLLLQYENDRDPKWKAQINLIQKSIDETQKLQKETLRLGDIATEMLRLEDEGNKDSIEYKKLEQEYIQTQNGLLKKKGEITKQNIDLAEQEFDRVRAYLNSFSSEAMQLSGFKSLDIFTTVEKNQKTAFQNMLANAKQFGVENAFIFNTLSEVAQDAYNFMQQNREAETESEMKKLELLKENALAYAETEEQKIAINKQFEKEQANIRRKQAQQEKQQAIFNAIINTAQAIVSVLAQEPGGIIKKGLAAGIVGAIGAAQIAMISAQKIPEFKDGVRDFSGGMAIVGDGGVSEFIRTPDGKIMKTPNKDTLVNLPKGTDVFKNEKDLILNNPQIANFEQKDNSMSIVRGIDGAMGKYFAKIQVNQTTIDKNGLNSWAVSQGNRSREISNRFSSKGFQV